MQLTSSLAADVGFMNECHYPPGSASLSVVGVCRSATNAIPRKGAVSVNLVKLSSCAHGGNRSVLWSLFSF